MCWRADQLFKGTLIVCRNGPTGTSRSSTRKILSPTPTVIKCIKSYSQSRQPHIWELVISNRVVQKRTWSFCWTSWTQARNAPLWQRQPMAPWAVLAGAWPAGQGRCFSPPLLSTAHLILGAVFSFQLPTISDSDMLECIQQWAGRIVRGTFRFSLKPEGYHCCLQLPTERQEVMDWDSGDRSFSKDTQHQDKRQRIQVGAEEF